jgi:metallophosphoesterase superfamily enzyme
MVGVGNVKEVVICPSFIYANEGSDVREKDLGMAWDFDYDKFRVIIVGDDLEDLDFGKLGNLR